MSNQSEIPPSHTPLTDEERRERVAQIQRERAAYNARVQVSRDAARNTASITTKD